MTSENWRAVVGFEGLYEVSDQGRARTLGRIDTRGHRRPARLLTPSPDSEGYLKVALTPASLDGTPQKAISCRVHVLVLGAFVGPCPDGMEGCHGNDIPTDNALVNLRWDTPIANRADQARLRTGNTSDRTRKTPVIPPGACVRGHKVAGANAARRRDSGRERCRACLRGHNTVKDARRYWGVELDITTEADRHYARIMPGSSPSEGDERQAR
jgi:hypothetical protein